MPKLANPKVKFCGDLLNIRRKVLGLSQYDIAEAVGVGHMAVHYWEIGKYQPRVKYIAALAKVLKTNPKRLFLFVKQS